MPGDSPDSGEKVPRCLLIKEDFEVATRYLLVVIVLQLPSVTKIGQAP